jgi:hypothetical protein
MNSKLSKLFCILFVTGVLLSSCAKDEDVPEDPSGSGGSTSSSFNWSVNNGASIFANDYYFVSAFNNIVGKKTSNASYIDISLDNLDPGSYTISLSKGILLEYNDGSISHTASSGIVNISSHLNGLLSGNFTASVKNSSITTISGQFTDIPEK